MIEFNLEMYEDAIESADKSLMNNPNDSKILNAKAIALGNLGRYEESLKYFDKLLEINQNDAVTWYNKALTLINLRRYNEALECLNKALKIRPDYGQARDLKKFIRKNFRGLLKKK